MNKNVEFARKLGRDLFVTKIFLIFLIGALCFSSLAFIDQINQASKINKFYDPDCSGKSLIKTAECLNDYVVDNFKYVINDDENFLNTQELLKRGGDCKDWTEFYERNFASNGYSETEQIILKIRDLEDGWEGHVFLVVSDETAYCTLDMTDVNCFSFDLE